MYKPTLGDIDTYYDYHLNIESWIEADEGTKNKAIITASRIIERLSLSDDIPDEIIIQAVGEIVLMLLEGIDPNLEQDNLNVVSRSYVASRVQYDRNLALEHIRAGVPSSVAWDILKPYLISNITLKFNRIG